MTSAGALRAGEVALVGGMAAAVALPVVASLGWDAYSHRAQYISELGAEGAPGGGWVSIGFIVLGLLLLGVLDVAATVRRRSGAVAAGVGVALLAGLGVSYVVSGFARCDAGCPETGPVSTTQAVHNGVGSLGYVLAVAGMLVAGVVLARRADGRGVGVAGLVGAPALAAVGLLVTVVDGWRGLLQRLLEIGVFVWLAAVVAWTRRADDAS